MQRAGIPRAAAAAPPPRVAGAIRLLGGDRDGHRVLDEQRAPVEGELQHADGRDAGRLHPRQPPTYCVARGCTHGYCTHGEVLQGTQAYSGVLTDSTPRYYGVRAVPARWPCRSLWHRLSCPTTPAPTTTACPSTRSGWLPSASALRRLRLQSPPRARCAAARAGPMPTPSAARRAREVPLA